MALAPQQTRGCGYDGHLRCLPPCTRDSAVMRRGARRRYTALEELAQAADGDARRFGGFRSSWRAQIKEELRIKGRSGQGAKGTGAAVEG